MLQESFFKHDYEFHFDENTDKAALASDILELIPYTIDRYYFNK